MSITARLIGGPLGEQQVAMPKVLLSLHFPHCAPVSLASALGDVPLPPAEYRPDFEVYDLLDETLNGDLLYLYAGKVTG